MTRIVQRLQEWWQGFRYGGQCEHSVTEPFGIGFATSYCTKGRGHFGWHNDSE